MVALENATGWPKEVVGWSDQTAHPVGQEGTGQVAPGATAEVTLAQPHLWGLGLATADTVVFRKPKFLGTWHDMYHWDLDAFWKVFGGRWVQFRWQED